MKHLQYFIAVLAVAFLTTPSLTLKSDARDGSKVFSLVLFSSGESETAFPVISDLPKPRCSLYSLVPRGDSSHSFSPCFNLSCSYAVFCKHFGELHYFRQLQFAHKQPKSIAQLMCFLI